MNILEQIAQDTRDRIAYKKTKKPLKSLQIEALSMDKDYRRFEKALKQEGVSFICEVKRASPSQGIIAKDFDPINIAISYQEAGAQCISCLTEPKYFLGDDNYLKSISKHVNIPILRKDFILDPYMIYEAKLLGASAVLFIVGLLDYSQLKEYLQISDTLGLCALVEVHNEEELQVALDCKSRIVGINNRDLRDFSVDIYTSTRLAKLVPKDVILVSESGIKTSDDIKLLESNGFHAVLIGQTLMSSNDKGLTLSMLRSRDIYL